MRNLFTFLSFSTCLVLGTICPLFAQQTVITPATVLSNGVSVKLNYTGITNHTSTYTLPDATVLSFETAPDKVYQFTLADSAYVSLEQTSSYTNGTTLTYDIFLLNTSNTNSVRAFNSDAKFGPGTHYVVLEQASNDVGFNQDTLTLTLRTWCMPVSNAGAGDYIARFSLGGTRSDTLIGGPRGRYLYEYTSFPVTAGINTLLRISNNPAFKEYNRIFIDYNGNGSFADAGELYYTSPTNAYSVAFNLLLDANNSQVAQALYKNRRIRVQASYTPFATNNPCDNFTYGQTRDFSIYLAPPPLNIAPLTPFPGYVCAGSYLFVATTRDANNNLVFATSGDKISYKVYDVYTSFVHPLLFSETATVGINGQFTVFFPEPGPGLYQVVATNLTRNQQGAYSGSYNVQEAGRVRFRDTKLCVPYNASQTFKIYTYNTDSVFIYNTQFGLPWKKYNVVNNFDNDSVTITLTAAEVRSLYDANLSNPYILYADGKSPYGCPILTRASLPVILQNQFTGVVGPDNGKSGSIYSLTGNFIDLTSSVYFGTFPVKNISAENSINYVAVTPGYLHVQIPTGATGIGQFSIRYPNGCPTQTYTPRIVTISPDYTTNANWQWERNLNGNSLLGQANYTRVRVDPYGSFYAAGSFAEVSGTGSFVSGGNNSANIALTCAGGKDGILTRYSRKGQLGWVVKFAGTGDDEVVGLAVDKLGYAYVCGYYSNTMTITPASGTGATFVSAGGTDMFVAKVKSDGTLVWAYRMGSTGNDRANGIDVTPDLLYYVAGSFIGNTNIVGLFGTNVPMTSRGNSDAFLAKFSGLGSLYWAIQAGGTGNDFGYGAAAEIYGGGYLMGSFEGTAQFTTSLTGSAGSPTITKTSVGGSDGFVLRVNKVGRLLWVSTMGGTTNENVKDVSADPRGTGLVAVGGISNTANFGPIQVFCRGFYDGFATRLDTNGNFAWVRTLGGYGQDQATGVRLDRAGNALVAANFSAQAMLWTPSGALPAFKPDVAGFTSDGIIAKLDAATGAPYYYARTLSLGGATVSGVDTVSDPTISSLAAAGFIAAGSATTASFYQVPIQFGLVTMTPIGATDGWLARYSTVTSATREGQDETGLTGITPVAAGRIVLWPNPTAGTVSLRLAGLPEGTYPLQVISLDGKTVYTQTYSAKELEAGTTLPLTLPSGLYTVQCQGHSKRLVVK